LGSSVLVFFFFFFTIFDFINSHKKINLQIAKLS